MESGLFSLLGQVGSMYLKAPEDDLWKDVFNTLIFVITQDLANSRSLSSLVCTATLQSIFTARGCVCDISVSVCLLDHTRRIPAQSTNSVPEVELSTCVRQKNSWVLWCRRLFFFTICKYLAFAYTSLSSIWFLSKRLDFSSKDS